jgi:hypothetical protein
VEVRWGEKLDAVLLRTERWVLKPAGHGGSGGIGNGQGLVMSPQGQVFRKGTPPDGQQCMVQWAWAFVHCAGAVGVQLPDAVLVSRRNAWSFNSFEGVFVMLP